MDPFHTDADDCDDHHGSVGIGCHSKHIMSTRSTPCCHYALSQQRARDDDDVWPPYNLGTRYTSCNNDCSRSSHTLSRFIQIVGHINRAGSARSPSKGPIHIVCTGRPQRTARTAINKADVWPTGCARTALGLFGLDLEQLRKSSFPKKQKQKFFSKNRNHEIF